MIRPAANEDIAMNRHIGVRKKRSRRLADVTAGMLLATIGSVYEPTAAVADSDVSTDIEATLGLDDNVSRAANNLDVEHDGFITLGATLNASLFQHASGEIVARGFLTTHNFSRYSGLSNVVAGAGVGYAFSPWRGFRAPWFSIDGSYEIVEFNSFLRDSDIARAAVMAGMNIDDATSIRAGANYQHRESEGKAFDTRNVAYFVNLDWRFEKRKTVYLTYKIQYGDTFSSATSVKLDVITASGGKIEADDVFIGKTAYGLEATTQLLTVGFNLVRDLDTSVDISARYLESDARDADLTYEGLSIRATYFKRLSL